MSERLTDGVRVQVSSHYLPEESRPLQPLYVFAYHVTISNESEHAVKLISRYWKIKDAFSRVKEVQGIGVVGQQPILDPNTSFQYTSFCPLPTETGIMEGSYQMQRESGEKFEIHVAPFQLVSPHAVN